MSDLFDDFPDFEEFLNWELTHKDQPEEPDPLFPEAVEVVLEAGEAAVSMLQRNLKLGYARAARIMDEMEEKGIVGPFNGSKPREVLITREQWETMTDLNPSAKSL